MVVKQPLQAFNAIHAKWCEGDRSFPAMLDRICTYVKWVNSGLCMIRVVDIEHGTSVIPMAFNRQQKMLLGSMMMQALMGKPLRLVILKARKTGCTTLIQTFCGFLCAHYSHQVSLIMAHQTTSTKEIFDIAKLLFEQYPGHCDTASDFLRFPSKRSRYSCRTAGGTGAGAGGTPTALHLSEVALCEQRVKKDLYTSESSVPDHPETIIAKESTARGRDEFWGLFSAAREDDEHPYLAVFIPWFVDDRLSTPVVSGDITELDEYEQWLLNYARDKYGIELTMGAIKWRREKIKLTTGGLPIFRQEYPATPEESVQGRTSLILPNIREAVIDSLPFDPHLVGANAKVGGGDFGYNDPTCLGTGFYVDQVLYVTSVYYAKGKLARDHAEGIIKGHRYFCDPSALQARKEVIDALPTGFAMLQACPRMVDKRRLNPTTDPEWDAVNKGLVDGKIKIMRSCSSQIILHGENFEWDEKTGKPKQVRNPGIWDHFDALDMLRYMYVGCLLSGQRGGVVIVR